MEIVSTEEYWQLILNDLSKVGQITTEDEEFNKIATYTWSVLQNTLVPSEDENYIKSFEEMVEIDGEGLDIFQRKVNILTTLSTKKYVPKNLIKLALERMDAGRFEIDYDKENNKLTVFADDLGDGFFDKVENLVSHIVSEKIEKEITEFSLPNGYKKLEYLECNGKQYIIIDYEKSPEMWFNWSHITSSKNNSQILLNLPWEDGGSGYYTYLFIVNGYTANIVRIGSKENLFSYSGPKKQKVSLSIDKLSVNIDGEYFKLQGDNSKQLKPFLRLLGDGSVYSFIGRIFYFEMGNGKEKLLRIIPTLDDTGAPCMYDPVNKIAFYNKGTGDFTYPTESTTYSLRRILPDWGKLTENGLRRLYHAPADYEGELIEYALENNYKQIIETEMPEEGHWTPQWKETEEEIVLEWIETEEPILEQPITE